MDGEHLPRVEEYADRRLDWWAELRRFRRTVRDMGKPWSAVRDILLRDGWAFSFKLGGEPCEVRVRFSTVRARFGERLWWHCPACGFRRVGLYAIRRHGRVELFCRSCLGLRYEQRQCGTGRALAQHKAVAAQLAMKRIERQLAHSRSGSRRRDRLSREWWSRHFEYQNAMDVLLQGAAAFLKEVEARERGDMAPRMRRQSGYHRHRSRRRPNREG